MRYEPKFIVKILLNLILMFIFIVNPFCLVKSDEISELYRESMKYYKQQNWEKAVEGFEKIIELKPEYKKAFVYLEKSRKGLANKYYLQGLELYNPIKNEEAINSFKKAIEYDPTMKEKCEKKIAQLYYESGMEASKVDKYEEAIEYFKLALQYEQDKNRRKEISFEIAHNRKEILNKLFEQGKKLYNEGNLVEANKIFQKIYSQNKDYPEVNKYISDIKKTFEEKAREYYLEGLKEYDQGNIKKAIQLWEKTLEYDPTHVKAQTSLERAKAELKKK